MADNFPINPGTGGTTAGVNVDPRLYGGTPAVPPPMAAPGMAPPPPSMARPAAAPASGGFPTPPNQYGGMPFNPFTNPLAQTTAPTFGSSGGYPGGGNAPPRANLPGGGSTGIGVAPGTDIYTPPKTTPIGTANTFTQGNPANTGWKGFSPNMAPIPYTPPTSAPAGAAGTFTQGSPTNTGFTPPSAAIVPPKPVQIAPPPAPAAPPPSLTAGSGYTPPAPITTPPVTNIGSPPPAPSPAAPPTPAPLPATSFKPPTASIAPTQPTLGAPAVSSPTTPLTMPSRNTLGQGMVISDTRGKTAVSSYDKILGRTPDVDTNALDAAYSRQGADTGSRFAKTEATGWNPAADMRASKLYDYNYKNPAAPGASPGRQRGTMAQELEQTAAAPAVSQGPDGMKRVDTGKLAMVTAPALGETQAQVSKQQQQIDTLTDYIKTHMPPKQEAEVSQPPPEWSYKPTNYTTSDAREKRNVQHTSPDTFEADTIVPSYSKKRQDDLDFIRQVHDIYRGQAGSYGDQKFTASDSNKKTDITPVGPRGGNASIRDPWANDADLHGMPEGYHLAPAAAAATAAAPFAAKYIAPRAVQVATDAKGAPIVYHAPAAPPSTGKTIASTALAPPPEPVSKAVNGWISDTTGLPSPSDVVDKVSDVFSDTRGKTDVVQQAPTDSWAKQQGIVDPWAQDADASGVVAAPDKKKKAMSNWDFIRQAGNAYRDAVSQPYQQFSAPGVQSPYAMSDARNKSQIVPASFPVPPPAAAPAPSPIATGAAPGEHERALAAGYAWLAAHGDKSAMAREAPAAPLPAQSQQDAARAMGEHIPYAPPTGIDAMQSSQYGLPTQREADMAEIMADYDRRHPRQ